MLSDDTPSQDEPDEDPQPTADTPTESAVDPQRLAKIRRKRRKPEDEARDFWRGVLADPIGRREMWKLIDTAHTFQERFECGPNGYPQSEATWFRAGEQSFGQRLYQMLARLDRAGTFLMHDEHDIANGFAKPKPSPKPPEG